TRLRPDSPRVRTSVREKHAGTAPHRPLARPAHQEPRLRRVRRLPARAAQPRGRARLLLPPGGEGPARYERAALHWHARLVGEAEGMTLFCCGPGGTASTLRSWCSATATSSVRFPKPPSGHCSIGRATILG